MPTTKTGELEYRPVSLSNLWAGQMDVRLKGSSKEGYLDFGGSRLYFLTISRRALLGSTNLSIERISTWRLRK